MKLSLALSFVLVGTARATTGWQLSEAGKSCEDKCGAGSCKELPPKNIDTETQMEFALAIATGQATYDCDVLTNGDTNVSPYIVSGTNKCSFTTNNAGGGCGTKDSSVQRLCCCHDAALCPGACTTDTDCASPATCIGNFCTVTSSVGGNCGVAGTVCAVGLTCIDKKCKVKLGQNGCVSSSDCAAGQCVSGTCKIPLGGSGCNGLDSNCASGVCTVPGDICKIPLGGSGCNGLDSNCASGVCTVPGDICKTPVSPGGDCADEDTTFCNPPAECKSNVCVLQAGESGCDDNADCETGLVCQTGTCKTPLNPGDSGCTSNSATSFCVAPADCVDNVCVLQEGESGCVDNTDCAAGLDCVDGVCQEPSGVEGCSSDANCDQGEECVIVGGVGTCQAVDGVRGCWARIEIWNFFWKWFICLIKWLWNKIF